MAALTVASAAAYSAGASDIGLTAAAGGGDTAANDGRTILVIANGSGGNITVTVTGTASDASYNAAIAKATSITAGKTGMMGPFPTSIFTSTLAITYSGVTSLTIAPVSLANALATAQR